MDREIAVPFRIDARGRVASTGDPANIARQHMTTFLLTQPRERVMRPDFGTPLQESVFEPLDSVTAQLLLTRVQERVNANVGTAVLRNLTATLDSEQATLQVTVQFALAVGAGTGVERSATITLGGGL